MLILFNPAVIGGGGWAGRVASDVYKITRPIPFQACHSDQDTGARAIFMAVASGAHVINLSYGVPFRDKDEAAALHEAWLRNTVVTAAAGNHGNDRKVYPAGYERTEEFGIFDVPITTDVFAVGSVDRFGDKSEFSAVGEWVDFWAPGDGWPDRPKLEGGILSTGGNRTYVRDRGTSLAAPFVAGVASLIKAEPGNAAATTSHVRKRLNATSNAHPVGEAGSTVDAYQAISNGSFESTLAMFWMDGSVDAPVQVGPITPPHRDRMLQVSSGPGSVVSRSSAHVVMMPPVDALSDDHLTVCLRYDFVTEEYPEYVGSRYNDTFRIDVVLPSGKTLDIASGSVNLTAWTPITGINFEGGDLTVGHSGWQRACLGIPKRDLLAAPTWTPTGSQARSTIRIVVSDVGDSIFDSVSLVDDIRVY